VEISHTLKATKVASVRESSRKFSVHVVSLGSLMPNFCTLVQEFGTNSERRCKFSNSGCGMCWHFFQNQKII